MNGVCFVQESSADFITHKETWCGILEDFDPTYDTAPRVFKEQWCGWVLARTRQDMDGNRNILVLNENDAKRNLNLNWFDNRWNRNYRFAFVRNLLCRNTYSALTGGILFSDLPYPSAEHFTDPI